MEMIKKQKKKIVVIQVSVYSEYFIFNMKPNKQERYKQTVNDFFSPLNWCVHLSAAMSGPPKTCTHNKQTEKKKKYRLHHTKQSKHKNFFLDCTWKKT